MRVAIAAFAGGCSASSVVATVGSPAPHSAVVSLTPLTTANSTRQIAPSQSLSLVLPEANLWLIRRDGTYYHATHAATASQVWIKRWRQGEVVRADSCAAQSLLWRPDLAAPAAAEALTPADAPALAIPPGYHTRMDGRLWADGETWHAQLTAYGAFFRDCFAYVYRTRAPRSPLGRTVLEQRLRVMQDAFERTRVTGPTVAAVRQQ